MVVASDTSGIDCFTGLEILAAADTEDWRKLCHSVEMSPAHLAGVLGHPDTPRTDRIMIENWLTQYGEEIHAFVDAAIADGMPLDRRDAVDRLLVHPVQPRGKLRYMKDSPILTYLH